MTNVRLSKKGQVAEADELEFRYRSLLAARRILAAKETPPGAAGGLRAARLRRLHRYVQNSIEMVERRMQQIGMPRPDSAGNSTPYSNRLRTLNSSGADC